MRIVLSLSAKSSSLPAGLKGCDQSGCALSLSLSLCVSEPLLAVVPSPLVPDVPLPRMLMDRSCWLLLSCTVCAAGGGIFVATNAGQMLVAVGGDASGAIVAVTVFGCVCTSFFFACGL